MRLQTEAKLYVQDLIRGGSLPLVWSAIMDIENEANPDLNRKEAISGWQQAACVDVSVSDNVEITANKLALMGIKPMDALHVACAMDAKADYFLTTDKALLRKMLNNDSLCVVDTVDFIRALQETKYED